MERLCILVLHSLGDPARAPAFLNRHVFALRKNYPEHDYLYHDASLPLPGYVAEQDFDAIILDVTFLTARWASSEFFQYRKNSYAFVRETSAVKIAFPQDEYDCNVLLDDWMCDWNIDIVFSVIATGQDILYPRYHKHGIILLGYTGYVDESLIDRPTKPFQQRTIDIGYRAKKLPPYFGRVGLVKWAIGSKVAQLAESTELNVDIKLGDGATLLGDDWLNFIDNSKFTLGANSGSSLLDSTGGIRLAVKEYIMNNPNAGFDEVEMACFPGQDGLNIFTAISPRVLECALLKSAQILVDGEYSGIIKPWDHFIPIRDDASNFEEVRTAMSDATGVMSMIKRCKEAILSVDALRYQNMTRMVLDLIGDFASRKNRSPDRVNVRKSIARYESEMPKKYKAFWLRQHLGAKMMGVLTPYPLLSKALLSSVRIFR